MVRQGASLLCLTVTVGAVVAASFWRNARVAPPPCPLQLADFGLSKLLDEDTSVKSSYMDTGGTILWQVVPLCSCMLGGQIS